MAIEINVFGATASSLREFVAVGKRGRVGWAPARLFCKKKELIANEILAEQDVVLSGADWARVVKEANALTEYPPMPIVENSGWSGQDFILRNGEAIPREGGEKPIIAFPADQRGCRTTGTLDGYREGVIELLRDQHLGILVLCAGFASPLLQLTGRVGNFGFQIVGGGGAGKSTIQRIGAAMCGLDYWTSFHTTSVKLVRRLPLYNSMPMYIDEVNLFCADKSDAERNKQLRGLAFQLASGDGKDRDGEDAAEKVSLIYLVSGNDPLQAFMEGVSKATAAAAADRFLTLQLGQDRKHGVFQFIPPQYKSGKHFAEALEAAAKANAGHLMRAYLERLVADHAEDKAGLVELIQADVDRFSARAGVDQNNGSMARVADAFGLLLSGGLMARRYGLLPKDYPVGDAILYCFRHLLVGSKPDMSFDDLFADYLRHPSVRNLDEQGLRRMGDGLFADTAAFLKDRGQGYPEAIVSKPALDQAIPGWQRMIAKPGNHCIFEPDKDRAEKYRNVRTGQRDRMIVIRIPKGFLKAA